MKCHCGGAGLAPEEVLSFDNALTRNALQAAAKWACPFSGVGRQVWSVQFWTLRHPGGRTKGRREGRESERKRERERGCRFVCSCTLSLYRFEWVRLCVFPLSEEDLKGMQLFLYTCPPPWGTSRACWKQTHIHLTHTHTHTERLWSERKYQTTLAEYLSRLKAAH